MTGYRIRCMIRYMDLETTCRYCGKPFTRKPKVRPRYSCSDKCKLAYNRREAKLRALKAVQN